MAALVVCTAPPTATLERVREFGTWWVIGEKPLILSTVVVEAMVMGMAFGGLGAILGAIIRDRGAQPRHRRLGRHHVLPLRPGLHAGVSGAEYMVFAVFAMFLISGFASLIPAFLAMRVSPVRAMQAED